MTDYLAYKRHAVYEKVQVETDLLRYGIFAECRNGR